MPLLAALPETLPGIVNPTLWMAQYPKSVLFRKELQPEPMSGPMARMRYLDRNLLLASTQLGSLTTPHYTTKSPLISMLKDRFRRPAGITVAAVLLDS